MVTVGRRRFLQIASALPAASAAAPLVQATPADTALNVRAALFIPGYVHESAFFQGRPVADHPAFAGRLPKGYSGPMTLVTRIGGAGEHILRSLMPLQGHQIDVSPDGRRAVFNSMNGTAMLSFDPVSLETGRIAKTHAAGFIFGGHSAYAPDGAALLVAERRDWRPFTGDPAEHFGRVVVRDPDTLQVLDHFNCHGIAPHEVNLLADGKHIAVANYGRTSWPEGADALPEVVEPSLTVLEIATGRLVGKVVSPSTRREIRHIAVHSLERAFAVQGRLATFEATQRAMADWPEVYEPDIWSAGLPGYGYLPAPALRYDLLAAPPSAAEMSTEEPLLMRYAQSIIYDPEFDEVMGTFPSLHCVIVFAGADGAVRRVVRTAGLGIRQPRGIFLHPNGTHYGVSGYWMDILMLRRGSHLPDPDTFVSATLFGHSHSTAAPA